MAKFLSLLRGINVGGKNVIAKDDLRACFEELGFESVRTYIQSGNILFRSSETGIAKLTEAIEAGLSTRFSYAAQAVVLPERKYRSAVEAAPRFWGQAPDAKHHALFTLRGTTPKSVLTRLPEPKADIDRVAVGPGVIFWSVDRTRQTRSSFMRVPEKTAYKQLTIRNHNTVFKLLELFDVI